MKQRRDLIAHPCADIQHLSAVPWLQEQYLIGTSVFCSILAHRTTQFLNKHCWTAQVKQFTVYKFIKSEVMWATLCFLWCLTSLR